MILTQQDFCAYRVDMALQGFDDLHIYYKDWRFVFISPKVAFGYEVQRSLGEKLKDVRLSTQMH